LFSLFRIDDLINNNCTYNKYRDQREQLKKIIKSQENNDLYETISQASSVSVHSKTMEQRK
jgi:hypothetical protein